LSVGGVRGLDGKDKKFVREVFILLFPTLLLILCTAPSPASQA
jgi:hypothetical protein